MGHDEADAFVFFGATGDLAYRQIFPALQALITRGQLEMPIIGVARSATGIDALRLLQVVALLTMDAPIGRHVDAIRDEKHRAFRAMRPLALADVVRGQFKGWAGVPFYIRTGKRMPLTVTELRVILKRPPQEVFEPASLDGGDHVRFRLSPDVSISLGARVKLPGESMIGEYAPGDQVRRI